MSIDVSGISITEPFSQMLVLPTVAAFIRETRDQLGVSYIEVGGRKLHLWQIEHDSSRGITRTYRDKEEMWARTVLLQQETRDEPA